MTKILASIITSYIIAFLIIPVIISYSRKTNVLDAPDRRKIHKELTPSLGGIAIFIGFIVSAFIWMSFIGLVQYKFVLVALSIIFIVGVRDDILPLRPIVKLLGQIIAASMVIGLSNIKLTSLYGILGVYEIHPILGFLISLFTIVVVTNAFNLIDGLDGLAGTIASISLLFFGIWFFLIGKEITAILIFCMLGSIFAFINFNWEPAKIFMGDTGALVLGFLFSVLAIHFIETNYQLLETNIYRFEGSVATALCVIIIPLCDTLRIFIIRIYKKKSPFKPDKSHIHHALMRLGLKHYQTAIVLGMVHLVFIGMALTLNNLGDTILVPIVLALAVLFSLSIDVLIRRKVSLRDS